MKKLLVYVSARYLIDYFDYVIPYLQEHSALDITYACGFDAEHDTLIKLPLNELRAADYDLAWTTAELLHHMPDKAVKIATFHHGGYGESRFIINPNVLQYADYLFCASYRPCDVLAADDVYYSLIASKAVNPRLSIVPIGYPKLDKCIEYIGASDESDAILIALSTLADNPYEIERPLRACIETLLDAERKVIFRPFPNDLVTEPLIKSIVTDYRERPGFTLSEGSYFGDFAASQSMIFFGRQDATTAYTYAYSSLRPCFFYHPDAAHAEKIPAIGKLFSDGAELASAAAEISSTVWRATLSAQREKDLDYVSSSRKRLVDVFNSIAGNLDIDHSFVYERQSNSTKIETAIPSLSRIDAAVKSGDGNTDTSYTLNACLQILLSAGKQEEIVASSNALIDFVHKHLADAPAQNFLRAAALIAERVKSAGVSIDWSHPVWARVQSSFDGIGTPSITLSTLMLRIADQGFSSDNVDLLADSLLESDNVDVINLLTTYYQYRDAEKYQRACARYVALSGLWDLDALHRVANKPYVFFGDGSSSRKLVGYLRRMKMALPVCIYADKVKSAYLEGLRLIDLNVTPPQTIQEAIVIASPEFEKEIRLKLLRHGVTEEKIIGLASAGRDAVRHTPA